MKAYRGIFKTGYFLIDAEGMIVAGYNFGGHRLQKALAKTLETE